ncbi:MAG: HDIG domain-containing metalloprotein [Planctomycetota bacterium]
MPEPKTSKAISRGKRAGGGWRSRLSARGVAGWREFVLTPHSLPISLILVAGVLISVALMLGFGESLLLGKGRLATETRLHSMDVSFDDEVATERDREDARRRSPRVYFANAELMSDVEGALLALPQTLAAAESFGDVAPEIISSYALTEEGFDLVRSMVGEDGMAPDWESHVRRFVRDLRSRVTLSSEEYGLVLASPSSVIVVNYVDSGPRELHRSNAMSATSEEVIEMLREVARSAGAVGLEAELFARRVANIDSPMAVFDKEATDSLMEKNAANVATVKVTYLAGQPVYIEGERLTTEKIQRAELDAAAIQEARTASGEAVRIFGTLAIVTVLAILLGGYVYTYYPRVAKHPGRAGAIATTVVTAFAIACWWATTAPGLVWAATLGPVMLVAMIIVTAYDRRIAVMVAAVVAVLIALTLNLPPGYLAAAMVGAIVSAWQSADTRHRRDVLRGGLVVGVALFVTVFAVSIVLRGVSGAVVREILIDSSGAGLAGFLASAITLVILPTVERAFDITTGMTLSELRDSSHPLLRKLQQTAPGTFNHSHTVAIIAEAAAESIGADGMHVYVGAMYHDIGKMNKPGYFVENQTGVQRGIHERLSPAMSVLVIVAHVKDGIELAKEAGLPRSLHHYIESHHGTTLVQYFYHRAKKQAEEGGDAEGPSEIEYRYPGPKPRTKEAAILMLADSVEAATRAMAEPTPARISALVREIGRKYLNDGQFDESRITLRELSAIEDSITKSLCGIYHGRVAYPKAEKEGDDKGEPQEVASA